MPFAPPGPVAPGFEPPDPVPPKAGSENLWPVIKVAAGMLVF
jgi:hypothetical protein